MARRLTVALGIALVGMAVVCVAEDAPTVDRYAQARELYSQGPSKAPEIIALLEQELADTPDNEEAIKLLGITYFGVGKFELALVQFDAVLSLAEKRDVILPSMFFYRARALYELKKYEESRRVLEAYWAFWQDSERLKAQYEALYPMVLEKLAEQPAN